jgi:hypothetical protein
MHIAVYQSFKDLPESVLVANNYPTQQNYLLSNNWFQNLFDTVLSQELDLRIYVATENNEDVAGILFCGVARNTKKLVSLTNFYSLEYAPIVFSPEKDSCTVIDSIIEHIVNEKPRWDIIALRLLRPESKEYACITESLKKSGFFINSYFQYENWIYQLKGLDFSTYYDERPSQLLNTIKRKTNKLKKLSEIEIKIFTEDNDELLAGISDYVTVYNNSWKKSEPYADFTPTLIKDCAKLGILLLGVLYVDKKPVAAQLWFSTVNNSVIYKLAYDEEYKKSSVGSILSKKLFEIAIDDNSFTQIDYGVGSENYKKDWMNEVREIRGFEAYNKATFQGLKNIVFQLIKNTLHKIKN